MNRVRGSSPKTNTDLHKSNNYGEMYERCWTVVEKLKLLKGRAREGQFPDNI